MSAVEDVVAVAAVENVVAVGALEDVVAVLAVDGVVTEAGIDGIVLLGSLDGLALVGTFLIGGTGGHLAHVVEAVGHGERLGLVGTVMELLEGRHQVVLGEGGQGIGLECRVDLACQRRHGLAPELFVEDHDV